MSRLVLKKVLFLSLVVSLFLPQHSYADTILISPAAGSYSVGQTFSVRIVVSSPTQAVNAVSAVLSFPIDKLQVTSVSKIGSILNLWVEEPAFSNAQGKVSLEGVVPNPGFTGSSGPILTVNFRVIKDGTANLQFSSASILANDGYGTNILKTRGIGTFTLSGAPVSAQDEPVETSPEPTFIDLNKSSVPAPTPKTEVSKSRTVSVEVPSLDSIVDTIIKFLSIVIPIVALIFFLIHTTKRGVGNLKGLRRTVRKDLHNLDRLVVKSFDVLKEDINDSIGILEKASTKRRLTAEENAIIRSLKQNLFDAEKMIHHEVAQAERDLGD
ncbi:cohesin domain-containing protein [Candidatus Parcubacteria bacterium]|nr:cohesin domain-containing protein [Candidatus Parcubacteria bacterium]